MKRHQGISLLEIILVVAVVGIILTLTLRYFVIMNNNLKITRAVTQIQTLAKASEQWLEGQRQSDFAGSSSKTEITVEKLIAAGLITKNDVKDPWGGNIIIHPSSANPAYVAITIDDVPKKACFNLIERMKPIAHDQIMKKGCVHLKKYFVEL